MALLSCLLPWINSRLYSLKWLLYRHFCIYHCFATTPLSQFPSLTFFAFSYFVQTPELFYRSLAAKLVLGMPFKVSSFFVTYIFRNCYRCITYVFVYSSYSVSIQDLATVDSILLRELPPADDKDAVRSIFFHVSFTVTYSQFKDPKLIFL
jgi:hypothetical protein